MAQAYVVRRKSDGKFYKNAAKPARAWTMTREQLRAAEEASHWTDDLQKARTYTNRGGAANAIPYRADKAAYEFPPVKLVIAD